MDTKAMAKTVRLTYWASVLRERSASGKSVRSWCRENGVCEKTYYYWQGKLRESAYERLNASNFVEVTVQEACAPLALSEVAPLPPQSQLFVEIAGVRITTDSTYPPDRLATLLRELTQPC